MSETDAEFIARMEKWSEPGLDADRLFALARRGAAMEEPWPEGFFHIGRQITLRCATEGCGQTPSMRLEINDTGSYYCEPCARKIARIVTKYPLPPPPKGAEE